MNTRIAFVTVSILVMLIAGCGASAASPAASGSTPPRVLPVASNPIVRFLYRVTEPVLRPIRHRLPTVGMGLDLSPMLVILAIYFLQAFLVESLRDLAASLRQ